LLENKVSKQGLKCSIKDVFCIHLK
jgi:hypothetical protein